MQINLLEWEFTYEMQNAVMQNRKQVPCLVGLLLVVNFNILPVHVWLACFVTRMHLSNDHCKKYGNKTDVYPANTFHVADHSV